MSEKICYKCKKSQHVDNFARNKTRKDGYQTHCDSCKKDMDREYRLKNISKFKDYRKKQRENIREFKSSGCIKCGEIHMATLDLHHVDPKEKEIAVSKIVRLGWSTSRIKLELDKCVVLCSNCHRKIHWNEK